MLYLKFARLQISYFFSSHLQVNNIYLQLTAFGFLRIVFSEQLLSGKTMTESQGSPEHARILNVGRKNGKVWNFFRSNFEEKSINVKKKCVSSIIRSIIGRLLRALGENELLNLMRVVSHTRNTEMSTIF